MRSLIARLALAGIVGAALAGCAGNGTPLSSGGIQGSGGGGPAPGGTGVALSTCTLPPYILDNGNALLNDAGNGTAWTGWNAVVVDTQGTGSPTGNDTVVGPQIGWTTVPPCAPPEPSYDGLGDFGYQYFFLSGSSSTQVIIKLTNPEPNLTYRNAGYSFNYTAIVLHVGWPEVASLITPSSVAVELAGSGATATYTGALAATYDVRSPCTIYPAGALQPEPLWSTLVCPLNGGPTGYGTNKNSQGPNEIVPGAAGGFTPIDPTVFVVFNYGKATSPLQLATPYLTYMYAYQ